MRPSRATRTGDRPRPHGLRRYRFIGGKGGAGKTTFAASLAIHAARRGLRTLVLSTDPAPSLADALAQPLGGRPRAVRGVPNLHAAEVNAPAAFAAWLAPRMRVLQRIAVRGTWLDEENVAKLLTLSLPGIDEIAALLQIVELGEHGRYDHVVVDSAPTGHLLRMMSMPAVLQRIARVFDDMQAKHRAVVSALQRGWTPDAADALVREIDTQAAWMATLLRDPRRAAVSWVTLPEAMSIEESADAIGWLRREGVLVDAVIVNRLTPPPAQACSWCDARRGGELQAMAALRRRVVRQAIAVLHVPAASREPRGVASLSRLGRTVERAPRTGVRGTTPRRARTVATISDRPAALAAPVITSETRLVFFGGKGGVGKTTCAAAAAIDAAVRMPSRHVLLLSVDPAHSIGDVLGQRCSDAATAVRGGPSNLAVREMDAGRAFDAVRERFADAVDALFRHTSETGSAEATYDRRVVRDLLDFAPPGVDELAAIVEVTELIPPASRARSTGDRYDLVVMDTAPTGHALRLLEMPSLLHEWVKAVMGILLEYRRTISLEGLAPVLLRLSKGLGHLRDLMADAERARFIAVTRPAVLPQMETLRLLKRLAAAGVSAPVLIANAAGAGTCRRCWRERAAQEQDLARLGRQLGRVPRRVPRVLLAPAEMPPPHGSKALQAWRHRWRELDPALLAGAKRRRAVR